MTDASFDTAPRSPPPPAYSDDTLTLPVVCYALYLIGMVTGGLACLAGLILAYVLRGDAGPRARSHYIFLINTFWLALIALALASVLAIAGVPLMIMGGVGLPLFMLAGLLGAGVTVWFAVRCILGMVRAAQGQPYPDPRTWLA